jgi:hypothetical protein
MNIFKADKAPFLLVLLLTAISWQISQIMSEIRSYRGAVSYRVIEAGKEVSVVVRNESRENSTPPSEFAFLCVDALPCLASQARPGARPFYGWIQGHPPRGANFGRMGTTPGEVSVTAGLPPSGEFHIRVTLRDTRHRVQFWALPNTSQVPGIYVYDRASLGGFIASNYLTLLFASVLLSMLALVTYLFLSGLFRRGQSTPANSAEGPEPPDD